MRAAFFFILLSILGVLLGCILTFFAYLPFVGDLQPGVFCPIQLMLVSLLVPFYGFLIIGKLASKVAYPATNYALDEQKAFWNTIHASAVMLILVPVILNVLFEHHLSPFWLFDWRFAIAIITAAAIPIWRAVKYFAKTFNSLS